MRGNESYANLRVRDQYNGLTQPVKAELSSQRITCVDEAN
jgi:hypothetical protein